MRSFFASTAIKYILLIVASIIASFFIFFGIGETLAGDASGVMHFITALPFLFIIYILAMRLSKKPRSKPTHKRKF